MERTIEKYFVDVHERTAEPLFVRLEKAFERMVATLPDQTLLPSERELAADLGVNRKTLSKAMESMVSAGKLRRTKKGTVVQKNAEERNFTLEDIHPFVLNMVEQRASLKVLLCDNLPMQVEFWRNTGKAFSEKTGIEIEYDWLPLSCKTTQDHINYAVSKGCHLTQLPSYAYLMDTAWHDMLEHQSCEITGLANDSKYRIGSYLENHLEILDQVMPLYFSMHMSWLNSGLARQYGIDISAFEKGKYPLAALFREAEQKLPESAFLLDHAGSLALLKTRPERITRDTLRDFYRKYLEIYAELVTERERIFVLPVESPYLMGQKQIIEEFTGNNLLMMNGFSIIMNYLKPQVDVEFLELLLTGSRDEKITIPFVGMGVLRGSDCQGEAVTFLQYLLRPENQCKMAETLLVAPMLRETDKILGARFAGGEKTVSETLNRYRMAPVFNVHNSGGKWDSQHYVEKLMAGEIDLEHAVVQAVESFFNHNIGKKS